jgi:hypothetical protein
MLTAIIMAALTLTYVATAVYVAFLTFVEISDWFQRNRRVNADQVGFTVQDRLRNGNYKTVQGVFNRATEKVDAVREIESSGIDGNLRHYHRDDDLVVYP